jgi:hypothetical protein
MPGPSQLALVIPILIFLIPIIAILTGHQRKMAEIYAQQARTQQDPEFAALRHDIQELKALVHQQAIALDNIASGRVSTPPSVPDRLNLGGA